MPSRRRPLLFLGGLFAAGLASAQVLKTLERRAVAGVGRVSLAGGEGEDGVTED